jgi:hypothetical protein
VQVESALTVVYFSFKVCGICLDDHLLTIDVLVSLGQGEFRGKVHLSHRCLALAAWNDFHLRRRQPCCGAIKRSPSDANMQLCRGILPGQAIAFIMLSKHIPDGLFLKFFI